VTDDLQPEMTGFPFIIVVKKFPKLGKSLKCRKKAKESLNPPPCFEFSSSKETAKDSLVYDSSFRDPYTEAVRGIQNAPSLKSIA